MKRHGHVDEADVEAISVALTHSIGANALAAALDHAVFFRGTRQVAGCTPQSPPTPVTDAPPVLRGMRT